MCFCSGLLVEKVKEVTQLSHELTKSQERILEVQQSILMYIIHIILVIYNHSAGEILNWKDF